MEFLQQFDVGPLPKPGPDDRRDPEETHRWIDQMGQRFCQRPITCPGSLPCSEIRKLTQQKVKQLTPAGIKLARGFLRDAREGKADELPEGLLTDSTYAKDAAVPCYVEKRTFANRREAGEYLSKALSPLGIGYVNGNYPLWSWIRYVLLRLHCGSR